MAQFRSVQCANAYTVFTLSTTLPSFLIPSPFLPLSLTPPFLIPPCLLPSSLPLSLIPFLNTRINRFTIDVYLSYADIESYQIGQSAEI